jgi:Rod binding domain-containing protein
MGGEVSGIPYSGIPAMAMLPAPSGPDLRQGQKAAREFEAQLIGSLLQSFEKTFATLPGQGAMAGDDDYDFMGTQALGSALAAGGGFGIARMIAAYLAHESSGSSPSKVSPGANQSP